jgi:PAS domain S-box-containing protein
MEREVNTLDETGSAILSRLIKNANGVIFRCRCDPHWTMTYISPGCRELTGYSPDELKENREIRYSRLIHPSDRPLVREEVENAISQNTPYGVTYRLLAKNEEKWVWERGQKVEENNGLVEGFITDVSERVSNTGRLIGSGDKSSKLTALMDITQDVASTLELKPLLGNILDKLKTVLDYDAASIMTLEDSTLDIMAYRGPISQEKAMKISFSLEDAMANRAVVERKEPIVIEDVMSDEPLARKLREMAGRELDTTYDYLRCWMGVPLIVKDNVIGMLTLDHRKENYYTFKDAEVALAFANQVAVAIENAQLYQTEKKRLAFSERRRIVAEGLRETMGVINSSQSLDKVLNTVLNQIYRLLDADSAAIFQLEEKSMDSTLLTAQMFTKNAPKEFLETDKVSLSVEDLDQEIKDHEPLVVEDISSKNVSNSYDSPRMQELGRLVQKYFGASIATPIVVGGDLYGVIILYYKEPRSFAEEEINLATSFADQASLAIENARLNKRLEEAAVMEERNRMARELHDSVTQSIYSVTLFAEAAKRMADQGEYEQVSSHLENVESMSQQALKEMRLLIYQMRSPEKRNCCFEDKIKNRLETVERRSGVDFSVMVDKDIGLPGNVTEELYMITQEALNNTQKHAEANRVEIALEEQSEGFRLEVSDDGQGFNEKQAGSSGGMGIGNMKKRAEKLGANFSIETEPGKGTSVIVEK